MIAHTVNLTRPEDFSSLLQLSLYLDSGTQGRVYIAQRERVQLDKSLPVSKAAISGAEVLSEMLVATGRYPRLNDSLI